MDVLFLYNHAWQPSPHYNKYWWQLWIYLVVQVVFSCIRLVDCIVGKILDVMELLQSINQNEEATMMLVTHDPLAASYCDRVIFIRDGKLYSEMYRGENRQAFFQKIIDTLSLLGGNAHDLSSVRL